MQWKIYYGDGSTYSDLDGPPELAPKRDVQAIPHTSGLTGHRVERTNDYYVWTPERGGWRGVDQFGLFDYLIEPGVKIVLFGRMLNNEEYRAILAQSSRDPDLPKRSAWMPEERRAD